MPDPKAVQSNFYIEIGGEQVPADFMRDLEVVTVESSLHLPDMASITLNDPRLSWLDSQKIEPGKTLKISSSSGKNKELIFDGEIVELEPDFREASQRLVIRGFDRMHRLSRGRHVRTFLNVTDGDVIQKIAKEVGLKAKVGPTTQVHQYVMQANETNLSFLQQRAAALGYLLFVEGDTLHCVEPKAESSSLELRWAQELSEFRPRISTIGQVTEVTARGWDPMQKREVMGKARDAAFVPEIGVPKSGGQYSQKAFNVEAPFLVADRPLRTQASADLLAKAVAEMQGGHFIEAEGTCAGMPKMVSGISVKISSVGNRFSGTYFVTSTSHVYDTKEGYRTQFTVSGLHPATLLSMMAQEPQPMPTTGLVIGIVTDNQDPENLGRVKVKYPWLSSEHTSDWARVVSVGAGAKRGIEFLPEVNDEVLIGFEQGNVHHPYILGGLWNGKDAPPEGTKEAIKGGKVIHRIIRSRTGHIILIDDDTPGGGITIKDSAGNKIFLDAQNKEITIESVGNMTLKAAGNMKINASGNIDMEGSGQVGVKGATLGLEGSGAVNVKGGVIKLN
ncbi:MAG: VgrG-related protein [Roseiflexaceae bacterium]